MKRDLEACPACDEGHDLVTRRNFLRAASAGAALVAGGLSAASAVAAPAAAKTSESLVEIFFKTLKPEQKKTVAFPWEYQSSKLGLLRTHISNNWRITAPPILSDFYSAEQQSLIREIFVNLIQPDWVERFDKQFKDDMGGFGKAQGIAIFGEPGAGKFEFVLSGRHGTVRCDGNSAEHVAFGGPILYGHAASGYYEKAQHPGNVFWHQAEAANKLYQMLGGKQQKQALQPAAPDEAEIAFRGTQGKFEGLAVKELSSDQKAHLQGVLEKLIEPYRQTDRDEVVAALKKQGGLDACHLVYWQKDDYDKDGVWDNWRLEGPSFVWHYRGAPHVHVWVNVSDDARVATNSKNLSGSLRQ